MYGSAKASTIPWSMSFLLHQGHQLFFFLHVCVRFCVINIFFFPSVYDVYIVFSRLWITPLT